jgi:choice-of-anchor B domain-containing protein
MSAYYRDIFRLSTFTMNRVLLAAAATLVLGSASIADTLDPPLYVAPSGTDAGNCLDESAPCRSIGFALQRVGKNGQVRVAAGTYALTSPEDVFYLVSNAIDVRADEGATLVGVAPEFAGDLAARGFRVIADSKGLNREMAQKLGATRQALEAGSAATSCVGGFAGSFPCDKVDLVSHVADRTSAASGADIWGFIDLNTNREYAIMGYSTGTAVYDISDAENPREVGFVDGQRTTWRDIKVYQFWNATKQRWDAYAYVTADNASDGLFIIDLTQLPQRISRLNHAGDFAEAHNVYLARADFSTGLPLTDDPPLLIIAGSNRSDGRFRTYSLDDPRAPAFVAMPATPAGQAAGNRLYMHDGASMLVTDARKDSQCVNAATSPWCDIVFDFNESTLDIWDLTDPLDPVRLSQTPYSNASYTHSGWWSEDQQYVFLQDELDERDRSLNTTLRAFSIADLRNPTARSIITASCLATATTCRTMHAACRYSTSRTRPICAWWATSTATRPATASASREPGAPTPTCRAARFSSAISIRVCTSLRTRLAMSARAAFRSRPIRLRRTRLSPPRLSCSAPPALRARYR